MKYSASTLSTKYSKYTALSSSSRNRSILAVTTLMYCEPAVQKYTQYPVLAVCCGLAVCTYLVLCVVPVLEQNKLWSMKYIAGICEVLVGQDFSTRENNYFFWWKLMEASMEASTLP